MYRTSRSGLLLGFVLSRCTWVCVCVCLFVCVPTPTQALPHCLHLHRGSKFPEQLLKVTRQVGCLLRLRSHELKRLAWLGSFLAYPSQLVSLKWRELVYFTFPWVLINIKVHFQYAKKFKFPQTQLMTPWLVLARSAFVLRQRSHTFQTLSERRWFAGLEFISHSKGMQCPLFLLENNLRVFSLLILQTSKWTVAQLCFKLKISSVKTYWSMVTLYMPQSCRKLLHLFNFLSTVHCEVE